jgi:hypothetical protein
MANWWEATATELGGFGKSKRRLDFDEPVTFTVVGHPKQVLIPDIVIHYDAERPVSDTITRWFMSFAGNQQSGWVFNLNDQGMDAPVLDIGLAIPEQVGYVAGQPQVIYCFYNPRAAHFAQLLNGIAEAKRAQQEVHMGDGAYSDTTEGPESPAGADGGFDQQEVHMGDGAYSDTTEGPESPADGGFDCFMDRVL